MEIDKVYSIAQELNENGYFGGYNFTDLAPSELEPTGIDGEIPPSFSEDENGQIQLKGSYHYFDDNYRLMVIMLYSDKYNIFGIEVGDTVQMPEQKLPAFGYSKAEPRYSEHGIDYHYYVKDDTGILIFETKEGQDIINFIQIGIDTKSSITTSPVY